MKKELYFITLLCVLSTPVFAHKLIEIEVLDPISGENTKVYRVFSRGSYIYNWKSKYDGIFWPFTDEDYIGFNEKSGYIAFGSDFENLKEEEKKRLIQFLKENYDPSNPPTSHIEKLKWLYKVYEVRGTGDEFKIRYYCLLSYLTRNVNESESSKYMMKALSLIDKYLVTAKPCIYKAHLYVVAGFYSSLLKTGNEEKYWEKLSDSECGIDDPEELEKYKEYLENIVNEIKSGVYKEE